MDKKITGIVAYLTIIGWIVAYIAGDKEGAKFHLNQALVIALCGIVNGVIGAIPIIGWIASFLINILIIVCVVLGIIAAAKDEEKEVPILGSIKILK